MSSGWWTLYVTAVVLICVTPGPSSLLAVTNGARYGLRRTAVSSLGFAIGLAAVIGLSLSGLGVLLAASETIFQIVKWLGACYLVYLGVRLMRSRASFADAAAGRSAAKAPSSGRLLLQGLWVAVANPKALLFFTAFLPQFFVPEQPFVAQFVVLAGTFVIIEFAIEIGLAAMSRSLVVRARSPRVARTVNVLTGGLFVAAGGYLATLSRSNS